MKKNRLLVILMLLFGLLAAVILFYPNDNKKEEVIVQEEKKVAVVVAKTDIPLYTVLTEEMLQVEEKPESSIHPNTVFDLSSLIGTTSLADLAAGEVILDNHILSAEEKEAGLALLLEEGKRAMSLSVNAANSVSYLLKVGNHVDVLFVTKELKEDNFIEDGIDERRNISRILFEDIEIVALYQNLAGAPNDGSVYEFTTVTLALTPEQTSQMALAMEEGSLFLSLRPQNDDSLAGECRVEVKNLFGKTKTVTEE